MKGQITLAMVSALFAMALIVAPAWAQLGMTMPVNPPHEPCTIQGNQINPNLPTGLLPQTYRWAPAAFLENDPTSGAFTKPDEQDGRLHYFLRYMAQSASSPDSYRSVLVSDVLLYLGLEKPTVSVSGVGVNWNTSINAKPADVATAVAQLAVTGRRAYANFFSWHSPANEFSGPQDADLIQLVQKTNPTINKTDLRQAVKFVLDASYSALWAIRGNDPLSRARRAQMGWIAVSGEDDTPHRPVNVPTAPYPQYDLQVAVSGSYGTITSVTRYMAASFWTFVGPDSPPAGFPALPQSGPIPGATTSAQPSAAATSSVRTFGTISTGTSAVNPASARTLPVDGQPIIPASNKIIIYIHGGGSRLEEAVPLANWLITWGAEARAAFGGPNQDYTVISFDLPNSAYGEPFDPARVYGSVYHPSMFNIFNFEEQYVIDFIEALDQKLGNIKNRIVAVMGGSLGGNVSLRLARESKQKYPYLQTIVAWSPTSMIPSPRVLGINALGNGLVWNSDFVTDAAGAITGNNSATNWGAEGTNTRGDYFHHLYFEMLSKVANIPSNPVMWFRDGWVNQDQSVDCKASVIAQSRFDRYEVYSSTLRRWTTAIDTEQAMYSFRDEDSPNYGPRFQQITSRLLLVAGEKDCYRNGCRGISDPRSALLADTLDIYGYTHDAANLMRPAQGRTLFIKDTGHSIHDERPKFFAQEIVSFLTTPDVNLTLTVSAGNTGLRWNSSIWAFSNLSNGRADTIDLNAWLHPWPAFVVSPDNPCGACGELQHFELRPNTSYTFTWGLSRTSYKLTDIRFFGINFFNGKRGGANALDTPDSFALNGVSLAAVSGPAGTGQMVGVSGQPLQLLTPSNAIWQTSQITQPHSALPPLEARVCPTTDGRTCSASLPTVPKAQGTTTPLKAIVTVTSNGRPVSGANIGLDDGTDSITDGSGNTVIVYHLFLYSSRQEQGPAGSNTGPAGKPRAFGQTSTTSPVLVAPTASISKSGFQPTSIGLPHALVRL